MYVVTHAGEHLLLFSVNNSVFQCGNTVTNEMQRTQSVLRAYLLQGWHSLNIYLCVTAGEKQ